MPPKFVRALASGIAILVVWAVVALTGGDSTATLDTSGAERADAPTQPADTESAGAQPADTEPTSDEPTSDEPAEDDDTSATPSARFSDLPSISPAELPIEAIDTLDLIAGGGPYPYSKDDSVFQNREGILPDMAPGHYREYTVETPGENDRGARRIVAGANGALYYTDDHYDSFREIVRRP